MNSVKLLMGVLASIALVACGTEVVGKKYVKSVDVPASQAKLISVDSTESSALAGTKLEIYADSLTNGTTITLEVGMKDVVANPADKAGPVAVWVPFPPPLIP